MNIPKKPIIALAAMAVLGTASLAGLQVAHAASPTAHLSIIDELVAKFHLNKDDVQAVFDQHHQENIANRQNIEKDRLAQAVTNGKLTQAQANAINAKQAEVKTFMGSLKDKTPTERKTAIEQEQKDIETWAKDNDIPAQFIHIAGPMMGHRIGFMRHMNGEIKPSAQ